MVEQANPEDLKDRFKIAPRYRYVKKYYKNYYNAPTIVAEDLENNNQEVIIVKFDKPWEKEPKALLRELKILRVLNCYYVAKIIELI